MIEINLVPDVKQELIRAERVRTSVISMAIIVGIAAIGVVVALAIWVFGYQFATNHSLDSSIEKKAQQISEVGDLNNTLTIQNQLKALPGLNNDKVINSRVFSLLATINPPSPHDIKVTSLTLDAAEKVITMEAQADNGYSSLETLRKTISATKISFKDDEDKEKSIPMASNLSDSDRSYGEDANGRRVLRFVISFSYDEALLSPTSKNLTITAPSKTNVTDSFLGIPKSLFTSKAANVEEDK